MSKNSISGSSGAASTRKYGDLAQEGSGGLNLLSLDSVLLRDTIAAVVLEGDAIVLGLTRDQGAVSMQLLSEEGTDKFYDASTEAFEHRLRAVKAIAEHK